MHIVFRADAALVFGSGHIMRCLTLASTLREHGVVVFFICREHEGHLCDLIEGRGFTVSRLPAPKGGLSQADSTPAHAAWLGAPWQEDFEQTRVAIEALGVKPDWLVVDHYAIDQRWERALRSSVGHIMAIDDLADRVHDCDLLLDQNLAAERHTRYRDKVPNCCGLLLGPEFALLQASYAKLHDRVPPRDGPIRRIFIFFGGADTHNLTGRTLNAFLSLNRSDIQIDVVIASSGPYAESVRLQVAGHDNIHLHHNLPTVAPLMVAADLAIGAGGSTSWERLCLGLPALVITSGENQRPIVGELHAQGLIRWLGHHDNVDESAIARALAELLQRGADKDWSLRCQAVLDGKGAERVFAAMTVDAGTPLQARCATLNDEDYLLRHFGDLTDGFRNQLRGLDSSRIYIVETSGGVAVAKAQFERSGEEWKARHILVPFYGPSLARSVFAAAVLQFRADINGALTFGPGKPGCWRIGICSGGGSWINEFIPELLFSWIADGHQVSWTHDAAAVPSGDVCFYLSYGRIVGREVLLQHKNNLVVHESDLPKGRGWSPLTWQVLEGADVIPVTLIEAAEEVDSGPIYMQERIQLCGDELIDELRRLQVDSTIRLCRAFMRDYPEVTNTACLQRGESSYYSRRRPKDGRLDPDKTLREQFNLLRISDNLRYPAWFEMAGIKYTIQIEKAEW